MGMAASQARFLGLTARKNNVEYEGQQINQQRTTLGNQSANYYNNLLGMAVPVPPSVQDYTKTVYTFQDGNLNNNITALIAQSNGMYKVSYVSSWQNDFTPVGNGAAVIFKDTTNPEAPLYKVGNQTLRELGTEGITVNNGFVQEWVSMPVARLMKNAMIDSVNGPYFIENGTDKVYTKEQIRLAGFDQDWNDIYDLEIINDNGTYKYKDAEENEYALADIQLMSSCKINGENRVVRLNQSGSTLFYQYYDELMDSWQYASNNLNKLTLSFVSVLEDSDTPAIETHPIEDAYLDSLTPEQKQKALEQEQEYKTLLNKKYNGGDQTQNWYVRYVQNTTSGVYEPIFYNENIVAAALYDENQTGASQSNIPCYKMGSAQETEEVKGVDARLEKDSTGRYINITLIPQEGVELTYSLTTSTITDQAAYEDAMNQYEFDKATYDNAIQEINSKIEIVQAEDKNLELRLKQLDTEQDAISTEMDAVQKVIEKNTESTFKTFG